jgi:hypothetical protein
LRFSLLLKQSKIRGTLKMNKGHTDILHPIINIEGVSRAWFEWVFAKSIWEKTLVVEVDFDTDPSSGASRQAKLEEIEKMAQFVLENKVPMVIHHLKVVPRFARI